MQLEISPDLETLINKRLSTSAYANAEEVVRHALQEQDAQDEELDPELVAHKFLADSPLLGHSLRGFSKRKILFGR